MIITESLCFIFHFVPANFVSLPVKACVRDIRWLNPKAGGGGRCLRHTEPRTVRGSAAGLFGLSLQLRIYRGQDEKNRPAHRLPITGGKGEVQGSNLLPVRSRQRAEAAHGIGCARDRRTRESRRSVSSLHARLLSSRFGAPRRNTGRREIPLRLMRTRFPRSPLPEQHHSFSSYPPVGWIYDICETHKWTIDDIMKRAASDPDRLIEK